MMRCQICDCPEGDHRPLRYVWRAWWRPGRGDWAWIGILAAVLVGGLALGVMRTVADDIGIDW